MNLQSCCGALGAVFWGRIYENITGRCALLEDVLNLIWTEVIA